MTVYSDFLIKDDISTRGQFLMQKELTFTASFIYELGHLAW